MHSKSFANLNKNFSNLSCPHNTYRLSIQIKSGKSIQRKIPLSGTIIRLMKLSIQTQKQCHRVLGNRIRRIGRYPDDGKLSLRRFPVYIIKAGTSQCKQLHSILTKFVYCSRINDIIHKSTDHITSLCQCSRLFLQFCFKVKKLIIVQF